MIANAKPRPLIRALALLAAAMTLPLLYVGGSVTTYKVGMAVPDWPTTFHENMFTYNFWRAPFGVQVEHVHRLYGAAVGLATLVLTVALLAFEPRRWLKALGVLALAAVIGQGVLGGLRVNWNSTVLAAAHGCVGQGFFGLLVALCVFSGKDWNTAEDQTADPANLRWRSMFGLGMIYAQILAGSWLRHFATPMALWIHSALAVVVVVYSGWLTRLVKAHRAETPRLVGPARLLSAVAGIQILLGVVVLVLLWPLDGTARPVPAIQAAIRTGHQTNGALLFAVSIVLTLRSFRHHAGAPAQAPDPHAEPGKLDLEAVA